MIRINSGSPMPNIKYDYLEVNLRAVKIKIQSLFKLSAANDS
jgi:hypothetical protein